MGLFDKAKLEKLTLRAFKPAGSADEPPKVSDAPQDAYTVQVNPSSYTLNRLGDSLPDFLKGFERDLARLELAMTQVFDEEETEIADLTLLPPDRAESMRLVPIKAFRLLALHYNSNDCFRAFRDGEQMRPKRGKTYLLVHRKDYSVMRMPLAKKGYELLRELAAGKTLGEAILACKPSQHALFEWFRDWSAAGIFRSFGE